ncbi:MAG TPA: glycosyltransferase family 9 protein [Ohtaekwangia sp.]|nr:glycosyltransferase family 9 protein [Ohtaekwangia sp.]
MSLRKILVLRFSAMGDVVLLVPVIRSLVEAHVDIEVTIVTRPKFASFFTGIERVVPFPADVDYTYNGIFGMRELFRKLLRKGDYEVVMDMHDHIRTIAMRTLFKLFGVKVVVFEKGRKEKKRFTQKENKDVTPLPHTVERYRMAFEKAGFPFQIVSPPYIRVNDTVHTDLASWLSKNGLTKAEKWIGIAPFAMHTSKVWPVENYKELIGRIVKTTSVKFFLFGGGDKEILFFEGLKNEFPSHCHIVAGQLKIKQEFALMAKLDLMICTDSSNMHLATMMNVPLISIWGGTHPDVGFGPFGKSAESIVQISRDELPCRPCSVYGRERCYRGDFACLNRITPEIIYERVNQALR